MKLEKFLDAFLTDEWEPQKDIQPIFYKGEWVNDKTNLSYFQKRIEAVIKDYGDVKDKKVLDMGCNTGFDSIEMAKAGAKVTAVDRIKRLTEVVDFISRKNNLKVKAINTLASTFIITHFFNKYDIILLFNMSPPMSKPRISKLLFKLFMRIGKTIYIDISPEETDEPYSIYDRKEYQKSTLDNLCEKIINDVDYKIMKTDYTYLVKIDRTKG